ncbi:MAG: type II 3-dehydroquinate dehydratase [Robiginitomaculum sp.]|nr:MAG: type II 3-dehydroquinate dehydratase [Robiginitomaculum sp.]
MANTIYILNGPNLNLLGTREPEIYGNATLADIKTACAARCKSRGYGMSFHQSNIEGEIVEHIQEAGCKAAAVIINAAAYTHTSVALYDSLKALSIPVIEVHISQPAAREAFRGTSYIAPVATGSISGFGTNSYLLAIDAAIDTLL